MRAFHGMRRNKYEIGLRQCVHRVELRGILQSPVRGVPSDIFLDPVGDSATTSERIRGSGTWTQSRRHCSSNAGGSSHGSRPRRGAPLAGSCPPGSHQSAHNQWLLSPSACGEVLQNFVQNFRREGHGRARIQWIGRSLRWPLVEFTTKKVE